MSVIVLNGGAAAGKAGDMADSLKVKGYTNQRRAANDWTGHTQTGNTVYCRAGLEREGTALAIAGRVGTQDDHSRTRRRRRRSAPSLDCVVVVGARRLDSASVRAAARAAGRSRGRSRSTPSRARLRAPRGRPTR